MNHLVKRNWKTLVAIVAGLLALPSAAFAQTTDPLGGATETIFDSIKDYQLVLIGAAVLLIVAAVAFRMVRKYASKAGSAS